MYIQKLCIKFITSNEEEKVLNLLNGYLGCLRQGGHILERVYPIIRNQNELTAFILTPEIASLEPIHENKYTRVGRQKIEEYTNNTFVVTLLGADIEMENAYCDCETQDFLILYTHFLKIGSSLHCGDCFGQIPLYKLKKTDEEGHYKVLSWETDYKACDNLQMNCTVGERFGLHQMSNLNSSLTKQGLERCKELAEIAQKPVYYFLFNYRKTTEKKDKARKCPQCGGEWLLQKTLHKIFAFQCDTCHLLSCFSSNL